MARLLCIKSEGDSERTEKILSCCEAQDHALTPWPHHSCPPHWVPWDQEGSRHQDVEQGWVVAPSMLVLGIAAIQHKTQPFCDSVKAT